MSTRTVRPGELEQDLVARLAALDERLATRRSRSHTKPARTRSRLAKLGLGSVSFLFVISAAMATNIGGFEIDANQGVPAVEDDLNTLNENGMFSGNDVPPGDDWAEGDSNDGLFSLSASAPHTGAEDCYDSDVDINTGSLEANGGAYDDIKFICDGNSDSKFAGTGGSILTEIEEDIVSPAGKQIDPSWPIKGGSVPGKDDFSHAYLALRSDHDSPCDVDAELGDKLLYIGAQRGNNNGDAFWGFEFDQIAPTNFQNLVDHSPADYTLTFNRTPGDILVSFVQEGGGDAILELFEWNGSTFVLLGAVPGCPGGQPQGDSELATNTEFPGGGQQTIPNEQLAGPWNTVVCSPTITDGNKNNNQCRLASETGGLPDGTEKALASRTFFEAVIDLEAFGINDICANNGILTSRSAHPLESADIKDVAGTVLNVCRPEIEVTKTPDITEVCTGSDTLVTYDYTVENTGNIDLTDIVIDDDTIPGAQAAFEAANGGSDDLAPGGLVSFSLSANIGATTTNIVTVTADSQAGEDTATDSATATVTAFDCTITVTKSDPDDVCDGGEVTYDYSITNNSTQFTWTGTLVDDQLGDVGGGPIVLAPGETQNFSANANITGTVTNIVTGDGTFDDPDSTSASDTATATVSSFDCTITVTKSDPDDVCDGGEVTYDYSITNNSTQFTWTGTLVDDQLGDVGGGPIVLAPGETQNFSANANITGTVTNIVTGDGTFDDPDSTSASDTATATVSSFDCTITVTKSDPDDVCDGGEVTYDYSITNNSTQFTWTGTLVDDQLGDVGGGPIVLAPGETQNFSANANITGTVTNIVTGDGTFDDPDSTSASDTATATVSSHPCTITVTKSNPDDVCNGAEVTYDYSITNNSTQFTWTGTLVDDQLGDVGGGPIVLAPGETQNFSANANITGTVTNIVTGDGTFDDDETSSASDTATATVTGHICTITVTKSNPDDVCDGGEVTYDYSITNNSTEFTWEGTLIDDQLGDVGGGTITLAPGETQNFSANANITGTVTNIVTGDGTFDDPNTTSASDTATATVSSHLCTISITKTPSDTEVCNGDLVDYDYLVTNNSDFFDWTGDVVDDFGTPGDATDDVVLANDVTIAAGGSLPLELNGVAITGTVTNTVTATGNFDDPASTSANADADATVVGIDCGGGCTPGFWQGGFGRALWDEVDDQDWVDADGAGTNPFVTTDLFSSGPWGPSGISSIDNKTMLEIVGTGGGNTWARKAARDLIAAYLNASFGIGYPFSTATILADWADAVADGTSGFRAFHAKYAPANELGCTIGQPTL